MDTSGSVAAVQTTLDKLSNQRDELGDLWATRKLRLDLCLQLRLFERDALEVHPIRLKLNFSPLPKIKINSCNHFVNMKPTKKTINQLLTLLPNKVSCFNHYSLFFTQNTKWYLFSQQLSSQYELWAEQLQNGDLSRGKLKDAEVQLRNLGDHINHIQSSTYEVAQRGQDLLQVKLIQLSNFTQANWDLGKSDAVNVKQI